MAVWVDARGARTRPRALKREAEHQAARQVALTALRDQTGVWDRLSMAAPIPTVATVCRVCQRGLLSTGRPSGWSAKRATDGAYGGQDCPHQCAVSDRLSRIEVSSFVNPKWIPRLADASEVARASPEDPASSIRVWSPIAVGSTARSRSGEIPPSLCRRPKRTQQKEHQ